MPTTLHTPEACKYATGSAGLPELCALPSPALKPSKPPTTATVPATTLTTGYEAVIDFKASGARSALVGLPQSGARYVECIWPIDGGEEIELELRVASAVLSELPIEGLKLECCVAADTTKLLQSVALSNTLQHLCVIECLAQVEECFCALAYSRLRSLVWCAPVTDVAVYELVRGSGSQLEALELSSYGETALSDDAVLAIASCCPRLTQLALSSAAAGCSTAPPVEDDAHTPQAVLGLTDEAIALLAGLRAGVPGCPLLRTLDLGGALPTSLPQTGDALPHFTDASVGLMIEGALPALAQLGLPARCPSLTASALRNLRAARPILLVLEAPVDPEGASD